MAVSRATPITLKVLRQELGKLTRSITIGTANSSSIATAIHDNNLIDSGESNTAFVRAWVLCGGEVRRATVYAPTTGILTVGRAFTVIPNAVEYEIHRLLSPEEINQAINDALVSLSYRRETVIAVVDNTTEYSLDTYDWILDRDQIVDVLVRYGDTASEYAYVPLNGWRFQRKETAEGTFSSMPYTGNYLQTTSISAGTDRAIVLRTICPYQILTNDAHATGCPFLWVMAAAEWRIYDLLARDGPATDRTQSEQRRERAGVRLAMLNRQYMERPKMTVNLAGSSYGLGTTRLQDES